MVEGAFIDMSVRFEVYERISEKKSIPRRRSAHHQNDWYPSEDDSASNDGDGSDDEDGGHGRGPRASGAPASSNNQGKYYSPSLWSVENTDRSSAEIKRESSELLLPRNNGRTSYYDAIRQAPSSAVSTAGTFARNNQATNTAETGAALSRNNDFTFHYPPPSHDDRTCVPVVQSNGRLRTPPSLNGAFVWPRPAPATACGIGYWERIVGDLLASVGS